MVDYPQLLARLAEPGGPPLPPWSENDWDSFTRHLGLIAPEDDEDPQQVHDRELLEDYRRSFVASHGTELHELLRTSVACRHRGAPALTTRGRTPTPRRQEVFNRASADDNHVAHWWSELVDDCPGESVNILWSLTKADVTHATSNRERAYAFLIDDAPEPATRWYKWALHHPRQLPDPPLFAGRHQDRLRFVIEELGRLGREDTIAALEPWTPDSEIGTAAVETIRRLRSRAESDRASTRTAKVPQGRYR